MRQHAADIGAAVTRRLVIAPHVDDDVIGCGGILGPDTTVFYCGVDEFHGVSRAGRLQEAADALRAAGVGRALWPSDDPGQWMLAFPNLNERPFHFYRPNGERKVNAYDFASLKDDFEWIIRSEQPDEVLLPWPSYNQDHQTVYRAAMVALRPHDRNHFVKRVLLYEEPDCFWPGGGPVFVPTLFRSIDIERKVKLYQLMPSQVRGHRSVDDLRALAQIRGAASGLAAAEAYQILRWVE